MRTQLQHKSFERIPELISQFFNADSRSVLSLVQQDLLVEAITFTGKTYKFSPSLLPTNLFSQKQFNRATQIKHRSLGNKYLQCFSRVAVTDQLQKEYFSWFDSYYKLETTQYLWGYARILLWYYNFDSPINPLDYRAHFTVIIEYLLNKPPEKFEYQYKQNAFLSLLYLLTFRAPDKSFCQQGSSEMRMAERVINHFSRNRIISTQVSRNKPLNQFFQEMIEGTATEDDLNDLVEVG